jgi:hypothetical protein
LLQAALEQHGPVRAGGRGRARREAAATGSRYAVSQGKRTMCHYSKTRQFAKPVRSSQAP